MSIFKTKKSLVLLAGLLTMGTVLFAATRQLLFTAPSNATSQGSTGCSSPCIVFSNLNNLVEYSCSACFEVTNFPVTATDICCSNEAVTLTYSLSDGFVLTNGYCFPQGSTLVTCTGISACGNCNSTNFTVTVQCTNNCTNGCIEFFNAGNIGVSSCSNCVPVYYPISATDNCCTNTNNPPSLSFNYPSGTCFPQGTTLVTCTATSACGNCNSTNFAVTVQCTTNCWVVICPTNKTVPCGSNWSFNPPMVSSCCSYLFTNTNGVLTNVEVVPLPVVVTGICPAVTNIETWEIFDGCGNSNICSQQVVVTGCCTNTTNCWVVICPTNKTVPCGSNWSFNPPMVSSCCSYLFTNTNGVLTNVEVVPLPVVVTGTCPAVTNIETWEIFDGCGNSNICSQQVVVTGCCTNTTNCWVVICPTNKTVPCGSNWSFNPPMVSSCCSYLFTNTNGVLTNVEVVPLPVVVTGTCPAVTNIETWEIFDGCGNSNICSQQVVVTGCCTNTNNCTNSCIEFFNAGNIVVSSCSNCVPVYYPISATDNCCTNGTNGGATSLSFNYPSGTCFQQGTTLVTCTATSACGRCNSTNFTVTVNPIAGLEVFCPTNKTVPCDSNWTFNLPTAFSCCSNVTITPIGTETNGQCPQVITQIWLITDACSNLAVCGQEVTVVSTPPTLLCASNKVLYGDGAPWSFDPPVVSNACCTNLTVCVLNIVTNVTCNPCAINYTCTWQVTDCCTNTATCSQTVTIVPSQPCQVFNTGMGGPIGPLAPGTTDPNFNLVDFPDGAVTMTPEFLPAGYLSDGPNSQWIGPDAYSFDEPAGVYQYELQFLLCCTNGTTLTGQMAADKTAGVYLNGAFVGSVSAASGDSSWTPINITNGFVGCPSLNVLDIYVTNYDATQDQNPDASSHTGLRAELTNCSVGFLVYCPSNKVVPCTSNWTFDLPKASSCCSTDITVTPLQTTTNGACPQIINRVWLVCDACSNCAICEQTVTVTNVPPMLECASNITVLSGLAWSFTPPTLINACCSNITLCVLNIVTNVTCDPCAINYTCTWQVTDCCTNLATCSQTVSVVPTSPCQVFNTGMNGSVPLPGGTTDPNFNLVGCPDGAQVIYPENVNFAPLNGYLNYLPDGPYSQWIGPDAYLYDEPSGVYHYQLQFLTCCTNDVELSGRMAADNTAGVYLNGEWVANVAGDSSWTPIIVTNGFVSCPWLNSLDVYVTNYFDIDDPSPSSPTAFRAELTNCVNELVVTCPTNKTVQCGTNWSFDEPTATSCCGSNSVQIVPLPVVVTGICPAVTNIETWEIFDGCGNSNICSQQVVVTGCCTNTTNCWVVICPTNKIVPCGSNWSFNPPIVSSCCPYLFTNTNGVVTNVEIVPLPVVVTGICPAVTNIETWEIFDGCGNSNICSQQVVVTGCCTNTTNCWVVICPTNKIVPCGSNWSFNPPIVSSCCPYLFTNTNGVVTNVEIVPLPVVVTGICPAVTNIETWEIFDGCGNSNICSQQVVVTGCCTNTTNCWVVICPTNKTVPCGSNWSFNPPMVSSCCSYLFTNTNGVLTNVEVVPLPVVVTGTCPAVTNIETWEIFDGCGNSNICSQQVVVTGCCTNTTNCWVVICPTNKTVPCGSNWSFNPPMVSSCCSYLFTNTNGVVTNVEVVPLPVVVIGTCPAVTNIETWEIFDGCGNSNICSQQVVVTGCCTNTTNCWVVICPTNKTVPCGSNWSFNPPMVSSCCSYLFTNTNGVLTNVEVVPLPVVVIGTCPVVTNTETWEVFDGCGNSNICSQQVVVTGCCTNTTNCTNSCIVFLNVGNIVTNSCSNCVPVYYPISAIDTCCTNSNSPPELSFNYPSGTCFPQGTTLVTCTATSACSHCNSTNFTVTVQCCVPPPANLVLWLPFDETNGSTSVNLASAQNSGTQVNHPTPVLGSYVANSLLFDGTNYVVVPDYPGIEIGTNNLTIDAWINDMAPNGGSQDTNLMILNKLNASNVGYSLSLNSGSLFFQMTGGNNYLGGAVSPGLWHFVAVSMNQSSSPPQGYFYLDGMLAGTFNPPTANLLNTNSLWVGASPLPGTQPWVGDLDEVEVFNRALSTNELYGIYSAGTAGKCKPCCYLQPPTPLSITELPPASKASAPSIELTWKGCGTLYSAPSVTGPWTAMPFASSPFITTFGSNQNFFILECP